MSARRFVVLHGANGCAAAIEPLALALRRFGTVHALDLAGHGGRDVPERPSIAHLAQDVVAQCDHAKIDSATFVGYSIGGYVALYLARHYGDRVRQACAIAAKATMDEGTLSHWRYLADPERLARPGNARGQEMARDHAPLDWKEVTRANIRLFESMHAEPPLSQDDFRQIARPVMLVSSNRDQLVPWAETKALGALIPGSKLVMFYGVAHPLSQVPVHAVARILDDWLPRE